MLVVGSLDGKGSNLILELSEQLGHVQIFKPGHLDCVQINDV
jgi:hypothetical protein